MAVTDIDVKDYMKFLLKNGSLEEKWDVISYFSLPIFMQDKKLSI